jgi:hypothetical protein
MGTQVQPIHHRQRRGFRMDADAFDAGYAHDRSERWWRYPGPQRTAYQAGWIAAQKDKVAR